MQMPDVLEGYYARVNIVRGDIYISSVEFAAAVKPLKEVWPTFSEREQENIMKLTIIRAAGPRTADIVVHGVGTVYISNNLSARRAPKENPDE